LEPVSLLYCRTSYTENTTQWRK